MEMEKVEEWRKGKEKNPRGVSSSNEQMARD